MTHQRAHAACPGILYHFGERWNFELKRATTHFVQKASFEASLESRLSHSHYLFEENDQVRAVVDLVVDQDPR